MIWVGKLLHENIYVHRNMRQYTSQLSEAARFDTDSDCIAKTTSWMRVRPIRLEHAVQDQVRAFIREYERDSERTAGEKAAVAAMKTLVFHAEGGTNLDMLQNSTLRTTQVLQAFMGLLSRMDATNETDTDTPPGI